MTMGAKNEVFLRYKFEYAHGTKAEKATILDAVCRTTGLHRKAAIRKFHQVCYERKKDAEGRGRPVKYGKEVDAALYDVWEVGAHCCAELLIREIGSYIIALEQLGRWPHGDVATGLLRAMSLGEMKRRISALRTRHRIKGRTTTTPSTIKRKVRVYAGPWRQRPPGHRQFDSVVHCGERLYGDMVYTINGVDTALLWSNRRAQLNKGEVATVASVEYIETQIPSNTLSRHADSGSEFLNFYFLEKSERARIDVTRCRSGKKNDNAFVEERNGNVVRKWIGYERYDTTEQVTVLNQLYDKLDLYLNHFQAVRRCIKRERVGARYVRVYDDPQTPYQRALAHPLVPGQVKQKLQTVHETLNPVTLREEVATLKAQLSKITEATRLKL
jgi:hypothetical protein